MTESRRVPLSRMRQAIARSTTASSRVPQFAIEMTADLGVAAQLRSRCTAGERFSYSDAIVASCANALREHQGVNASFADDAIVEHAEVNVSLAVALEQGLVAPAIRGADRRRLSELVAERVRLTEAARAGALTPEELLSGTFTVSNLGPFGVTRFTALVVPPQAAILAVGAADREGCVNLTLSCDHRVVDGAPAAEFLARVVGGLEDQDWLQSLLS